MGFNVQSMKGLMLRTCLPAVDSRSAPRAVQQSTAAAVHWKGRGALMAKSSGFERVVG